jgi:hypothetical protein
VVVGEWGAVSRWRIPLFETDAVEEHVGRPAAEPAGEDHAIVSQNLFRNAVGAQSFQERVAHRTRRRARYHLGDDAKARVIVDAGDD